ncbi:26764_t:CDS:2, partial [Gigaspora margarita]
GSLGYVVSASFLKKAGILIDCLSTIMMIGMHSEQKRPLEEIDRFPVTVETKTITSKAIVTEAANYAVIILTKYCKLVNIGDQIIKKKRKKIANKGVDEENESKSGEKEETDSEDENEDDEYKEKILIAQPYLYCEFRPVEKQLKESCTQYLKEGHRRENCIV